MKLSNITQNWNFQRVLYLVAGIFFIIVAFMDRAWWMSIFGIYFSAMSILGTGCAGNNCQINPKEKGTKK